MSRIINVDGVGEALFVRSRRARRLNITLEEGERLRVAIPYWVSFSEAKALLEKNVAWVDKFIEKIKKAKLEHSKLLVQEGELSLPMAKKALRDRLERLSSIYGYEYNRVQVRSQRTRWGSCSHNNNISLNIKLNNLPQDLKDYVILHELVHTKIKNHSKAFWQELESILPHARYLDKQLRKYQLALM